MADRSFKIKKNREDTLNILRILVSVLNKYNIAYYLDFGTLLGAVREKELIPWDDDIDISLLNKNDYEKIPNLVKEIKNKYKLRTYLFTFKSSRERRIINGNKIYEEKIKFTDDNNYQILKIRNNRFWIFGRGNVNIDVFFKYHQGDNLFWLADGKSNKISNNIINDELIKIKFYDIQCTIPKNYDEYLTTIYGDWKTPNKDWVENDSITQVKNDLKND